jgi:hypothetical protein
MTSQHRSILDNRFGKGHPNVARIDVSEFRGGLVDEIAAPAKLAASVFAIGSLPISRIVDEMGESHAMPSVNVTASGNAHDPILRAMNFIRETGAPGGASEGT